MTDFYHANQIFNEITEKKYFSGPDELLAMRLIQLNRKFDLLVCKKNLSFSLAIKRLKSISEDLNNDDNYENKYFASYINKLNLFDCFTNYNLY
jgi:hypothetical protein